MYCHAMFMILSDIVLLGDLGTSYIILLRPRYLVLLGSSNFIAELMSGYLLGICDWLNHLAENLSTLQTKKLHSLLRNYRAIIYGID